MDDESADEDTSVSDKFDLGCVFLMSALVIVATIYFGYLVQRTSN